MAQQAVVVKPGQAKSVTLAGEPLAMLVTKKHTKHTSMFDWTVPPGFFTGFHVHEVQEETFYVVEGECDWQIGGQHVKAKQGTYAFIPPGVPHNIGNSSGSVARMIMTVSPPGHEDYFAELSKLVKRSSPPDMNAVDELRSRYDTRQLSGLET